MTRLARNVEVVTQWVARLTRNVEVVAQWVARLTRNVEVVSSSPIKGNRCFLEQETYCLVLIGSRNGFERDFTIELK